MESIELLLIEDNMEEADLVLRNLKKTQLMQFAKHIATGEEALDYIFSKGKYERPQQHVLMPKVIVLDLGLPGLSGKEVLMHIRQDPRTKFIPVVILTSNSNGPCIEECYNLGANSYIRKPVDTEDYKHLAEELRGYWAEKNTTPTFRQNKAN
jgi:two-component system response regulator